MSDVSFKICGLKTAETVAAAVDAGARYLGFNFYPKTPRYVAPDTGRALALAVPDGVCKVGLFVDAADDEIAAVLSQVPVDMLQLHGAETPDRVAHLRQRFGLPVMRAIAIGSAADLDKITTFGSVADQLLVDAKPPPEEELPGGTGLTFDWRLIEGRRWPVPWMLAGGLTADNVADAVRLTGARQVDVSSGVEQSRGVKDIGKINAFGAAVTGLA